METSVSVSALYPTSETKRDEGLHRPNVASGAIHTEKQFRKGGSTMR